MNLRLVYKRPDLLLLTFFGLGLSPFAPGTVGSFFTIPLLYILGLFAVPKIFILIVFTLIFTITAIITEKCQKEFNRHDPSWIVIDEVFGMLTTWLIAPTISIIGLMSIFFIFRLLDIFKPWPASWADQKIKHGVGTHLDDIISGIYSGLIILLIQNFYPQFF